MTVRRQPKNTPQRILLVSDTHGVLDERIAACAQDCDLVVHAGDIGNRRILSQLRARSRKVRVVRGNNDTPVKWPSDERLTLDRLSHVRTIPLPGGDLVVVHGDAVHPAAQRHRFLRQRYSNARAVVYGHTHKAVCDTSAKPWILNPGAAGRVRTHGGPSCIELHATVTGWRTRLRRFPPIE